MERRIINPWTYQDRAGFVQASEITGVDRIVVCSGQASVDSEGTPEYPGDIVAQVHQTLDNIETVLAGAGMTLADVVRLNYYTTDMDAMVGAFVSYRERLADAGCHPSSSLLGVTALGIPGLMVEIEATAMA